MSKLTNISTGLINIKGICDNSHKHCVEIVQIATKFSIPITQEYFNKYLIMIDNFNYSCCLSTHYNKKNNDIKKFIILNSVKLKINYWKSILQHMSDDELYNIILNQLALEPNIISQLVILGINNPNNPNNQNNPYNQNNQNNLNNKANKFDTNFVNMLISKTKTFNYIILSMNIYEFSNYIDIITKNHSSSFNFNIENTIIQFIDNNKNKFMCANNIHIGLKIINTFITKPNILKNIYQLISNSLSQIQRQSIFDKIISTLDINLLLLILEKKDIVFDITNINRLLEKSYLRPEGAHNSNTIAEIIDVLCEYGLVINKAIILKLLEHGCHVNNLEKHGIIVDNEILAKCADLSYYPYKFDIVPNSDILKKECSKQDNLNTIRKLKEFGGIYTTECLEEACKLSKNGKVIKYLITDCNVKITEKCLEYFQQTYRIDALDAIMNKYKLQNPVTNSVSNNEKCIEINEKSTMTITPNNIQFDIQNNTIEYQLKNKIKKFFGYDKKTITYSQLHEIFLRYLVTNKLVIGKYFVINTELSNLLKINNCVIMDTKQIPNILTYFIDLQK